jgi:archaeosortase A (PGF-CTERM-specific)
MIFAAAIFATERIDTKKIDDEYFLKKLAATEDLGRRKWKAFLVTIPVIYLLNLVRNVGVTYGVFELGMSFEVVHNYIAKTGSLIAMVVLAIIVFRMLPEVHNYILNLFALPKRKRGVNVG